MKTLTVDSIYSNYALYQILYGRDSWYHMFTADAIHRMCLTWMQKKKVPKLQILEMFSGKRELEPFLIGFLKDIVSDYKCLELSDFDSKPCDNTVYADAYVPGDWLYTTKSNVILIPYFAIQGTAPVGKDFADLNDLLSLFKNCRSIFKKSKGMVYLHYDSIDSDSEMAKCVKDVQSVISIPISHPIRKDLGMSDYIDATLYANTSKTFDRTNGLLIDTFKDVWIETRGRLVANIKVKKPYIEKHWSNAEVTYALKANGFNDFDWYETDCSSLNSGDFSLIHRPALETPKTINQYFDILADYKSPHHLVAS